MCDRARNNAIVKTPIALIAGLLIASATAVTQVSKSDDACASLASVRMPDAAVTLARVAPAGAFTPPAADDGNRARPIDVSAAFCRVTMTLTPSKDSAIKVEVWMPVAAWNGKFQAVGNGAFNGAINYGGMAAAIARRYAVASTDTGHVGGGAAWALGHPEKVIDFGWRAVHEMTVASKRIVDAYYKKPPRFSYWNGCSAGGRQAMKEVQRFPGDFDGVIAGAPALDWTGRAAQANRLAKLLEANAGGRLLAADRQALHAAVVDACDSLDGVKDGLIENPENCAFDPGARACQDSSANGCLTLPQVETARTMYASPPNPASNRRIEGLRPGSELGWTDLGWTASARATGLDHFRFLVFADAGWSVKQFDFDRDIARAEERDAGTSNALDPHIEPFIRRGGKLIHYHGWSDPQISPGSSVQYYTRVVEALGGADRVHRAYRLFMAPGMAHCGGGEGPNTFDALAALERWVEAGTPPDSILASHATAGAIDRTRPLCPYPQAAVYAGSGSQAEASSFACALPPSPRPRK
jgi:feruloyl esterase